MLETTRIRREGYAFRLPFDDFFNQCVGDLVASLHNRYRVLAFEFTDKKARPTQSCCVQILTKAEQQQSPMLKPQRDLSGWQCGKTKMFLKYWHIDILAAQLLQVHRHAVVLQVGFCECCIVFIAAEIRSSLSCPPRNSSSSGLLMKLMLGSNTCSATSRCRRRRLRCSCLR